MKILSSLLLSSISVVACASANASSLKKDFSSEVNKPKILSYESDASGFHTKSFIVISGNEAALIDTQFTPAHTQKALESFSKNEKWTLKYAIATHPNPDKFNGAAVAQSQGAKFLVSEATAKALPEVHAYNSFKSCGARAMHN